METLAVRIARDEPLKDVDCVGWIIRLAKTIEPVHTVGVAHGRISAEAIQIAGSDPASRGLLTELRHLSDLAAYHSPERTIGEGISAEDDTWAVAVTLYFALTRKLPFPGTDDREVRKRIFSSPPSPLTTFDAGDDRLQQIVNRCLSRDAPRRITSLRELREALEVWHPDPAARRLQRLEHTGSLLLALSPAAPSTSQKAQGEVQVRRAPVVKIYSADEEEEDGPTKVRDVSTLQAHLAELTGQSAPAAAAAPAAAPEPVATAAKKASLEPVATAAKKASPEPAAAAAKKPASEPVSPAAAAAKKPASEPVSPAAAAGKKPVIEPISPGGEEEATLNMQLRLPKKAAQPGAAAGKKPVIEPISPGGEEEATLNMQLRLPKKASQPGGHAIEDEATLNLEARLPKKAPGGHAIEDEATLNLEARLPKQAPAAAASQASVAKKATPAVAAAAEPAAKPAAEPAAKPAAEPARKAAAEPAAKPAAEPKSASPEVAAKDEPPPAPAPILPFEPESARSPGPAPVIPFDRDSEPERQAAPATPPERERKAERKAAPVIPFARESAEERAQTPAKPAKAAAAPVPVQAAAVQAKAKGGSQTPLLIGLGLLIAGGAGAYFLFGSGSSSSGSALSGTLAAPSSVAPPASSAAVSASPSAQVSAAPLASVSAEPSAQVSAEPSGSASAAPSASVSAAPSASVSAAPSASVSAAPSAPGAVAACMMPLFATGTFADAPATLDSLCQITDPRRGVEAVKMEVILGGAHRVVSDGMREWAILGWYGMPAFAALKAMCCPSNAEVHIPFSVPECDIETALKALVKSASSATASDEDVSAALEGYTKAAKCTARAGQFVPFGQKGGIQEGELVTFQKTLARVRAAAKKK